MEKTKLKNILSQLPSRPGVYLFFNSENELIYIGKATSLKSRVRSYFQGQRTPRPIEEMLHEVENIKWEETETLIEAVILEANKIKKHQPRYNVIGKDDKSWNYLFITKEEFPRIETVREHDLRKYQLISESVNQRPGLTRLTDSPTIDQRYVFGPFPGLNNKAMLKILRHLFQYSTCQDHPGKACFYYQIHQCLGVCTGEISSLDYKRKVIRPMVLFLKGKKKKLILDIKKEMKMASKSENFEEASRLRDQLLHLEKIQDFSLLNKTFLENEQENKLSNSRIEGYDISNLGSTGMVGSMVVFENGLAKKSDYRKFKIRSIQGQSDVDCLAEVFERRLNHPEWPLPYIFLIDGGRPQVNKIFSIVKKKNLKIPVVGLAKGPTRKKNDIFIENADLETQRWIHSNIGSLIQVRDEAHRFAIKFQRSTRKIK